MADSPHEPSAELAKLQQSEIDQARLAAIIDSSDDAIVSKTLDGVITTWNRAAERIFGWSAAEAVGRHITMMIPEERRSEEVEVLARIRRGESVDHFETIRVTKSGQLRNISLTVSPIRNAAGRIIGASKIARDITERRRMEEEWERLLAREQEARAQAEALNRTKDVFLATVSHELRTPLNAIFGWARMLQSTEMDEATRAHAVAAIVRGASAQAQLIEDLLDLSRIVTGRMRLDVGRLDLGVVIEAAVDAVRPAASAKEIALTTALDASVGPMAGAADRLQQVVWNLVSNAVKFTPRGGRVEVTLRRANGSAEIVVTDTGEGIAPEVLPYVFDQFRQEDSSSTRAHRGLGLGLALVRHLVELHGGRVRADSPGKGKGASFTVALPLVPLRGERQRPPAARGEPAAGDGSDTLRDLRVLVVDDDADALDVASMLLRDRGADVRTATSAFRAFDIVKTWEPEVLVSDLAMPGEDGFMLLRAMRGAVGSGRSRLPAIAVTAYKTAENQMRALQAGFDLYLTKPVDPLELTAAVAEVARRAQ
jgi:PAS domain S-box-containing protein